MSEDGKFDRTQDWSLTTGVPEIAIVTFKIEVHGQVIQNSYTDINGSLVTTDEWTSTWYNGWYRFEWDDSLLNNAGELS